MLSYTYQAMETLSQKRVLFAVTKSNGGGAQAYVLMMAKGAREAGAQVAVMAGGADGAGGAPGFLFAELAAEGIRTIPLSSIRRDVAGASEWQAFKELLATIKKEKPDVLHLNSSKMGVLGGLAGRIAGVKRIIFTAHGWPNKESRPLLWKIMAWIGSWLTIVLAHKVIVVSENDLRESPTLLFRDKLALVHNGVNDFPRASRSDARAALAVRAPELSAYPQWLFMNAELHPNKGIGTAIRALAELASEYPGLALVVCGEGDRLKYLTGLADSLGIASRVFLLGFVPHARENLAAADMYLLPSLKEGLPIALLEAGLASLPVVASNIGGIPEVITDQETGLYMPRGNTHILAKCITYLFAHPEKASRFGSNLREKVLANFSEKEMVEKTISLY